MNSVKGNINMNRIPWWRSSSRTCIINWAHWTQWSEGLTLLATVNFEPDIITLYNMAFCSMTFYNMKLSTVNFKTCHFKTCHFKTCHFKICHFKTCHYKIWHKKRFTVLFRRHVTVNFSNMFVHVLIYLHTVCKSMLKRVLLRTWYRQLCCQVLIKRKCIRYL